MAFVRREEGKDAIWQRAWTADTLDDLEDISAILGPNGPRHGDVAFVDETGTYYWWQDNGTWFSAAEPSGGLFGVGQWIFSNQITAPPTGNQCRFNNGFPLSGVTKIWLTSLTDEGVDAHAILLTVPVGAIILIQDKNNSSQYLRCQTNLAPVDFTTYVEFSVTWEANGALLSNNQACIVRCTSFGAGDVDGPASSVDDNLVAFDGTTGKILQDSGIASADVALLSALNVFIQNQRISKTNPKWLLNDPGASANQRLISIDGTAGDFSFEFLNDDGTLQTLIFSVQRSTGNAQFAVDLEVLGLIGAAGGTVLFPGTQIPSANVNALDDYEEGTHTPTLTFGGASTGITYTAQQFTYTKIGRQVCVCGLIVLSSKGSATGDVAFTLPFPVASGNEFASANGLNFDAMAVTVNNAIASCINGTSTAFIFQTAAGTTTRLNDTDFTNTSVLVVQVNYFTDT